MKKVKEYINTNKKRPSTHDKNKDIKVLGSWINTQQINYKKNKHIITIPKIRIKWEEFQEEYKEYFISNEEIWISNLKKVKEYININKKRSSNSDKNKEVKALASWIGTQQKNYEKCRNKSEMGSIS